MILSDLFFILFLIVSVMNELNFLYEVVLGKIVLGGVLLWYVLFWNWLLNGEKNWKMFIFFEMYDYNLFFFGFLFNIVFYDDVYIVKFFVVNDIGLWKDNIFGFV